MHQCENPEHLLIISKRKLSHFTLLSFTFAFQSSQMTDFVFNVENDFLHEFFHRIRYFSIIGFLYSRFYVQVMRRYKDTSSAIGVIVGKVKHGQQVE